MPSKLCLSVAELHVLAKQALMGCNVSEVVAGNVADILVEADLRGIASHGVARLPNYLARVQAGLIDAAGEAEIVHDQGGLVIVDGHNGLGPQNALFAMEISGKRARQNGVAWVSVRNSNHFGIASAYTRRLAQQGLAAICLSNAAPAMAAFGGKRPVLGTNPVSMAVPGREPPIVLDMATTVVARGKIREAARENKPIPPGLALDAEGDETEDPHAALKGTLAPIGGPKGYGLAVMVDLMTGFFSGGNFSSHVGETTDFDRTSGACFTLIVADTSHMTEQEKQARIAAFSGLMQGSADEHQAIMLPGDPEEKISTQSLDRGIEISDKLAEELRELAEGRSSMPN